MWPYAPVLSQLKWKCMNKPSKVDMVGVGLNATDTLMPVTKFPVSGSKVEFRNVQIQPGGQTATTVIACQMWGMQTRYVGKLGDDRAAVMHREAFDKVGTETQLIHAHGCDSPQSMILVEPDGERTVLLRRDERVLLQPQDLKREWVQNARSLHIDGFETAAALQAATWAREAGIPVIADLDEVYAGIELLLEKIDYAIASRDFPCRMMSEDDLELALKMMHTRYGNKLTAATLGPDGVLAWDGEQFHYRAAYRVPVRDTTGAGDIFHAGFIYGLMQGWEIDRQLDFACAAAALNCSGVGARGGIRSVEEIEALMATGERHASFFTRSAR